MDQDTKTTIIAIEFNNCDYWLWITDEGTLTGNIYEAALLNNPTEENKKQLLLSVGKYAACIANYKPIPTKIRFVTWGQGFPAKGTVETYTMLAYKHKKKKAS